MRQRIELPLAGELLNDIGQARLDVLAVSRESKRCVRMIVRHEGKIYGDRFDGSKEDCDTLELEAAGKDIWATVAPDDDDAGKSPEIISVEVVGND